MSHPHRPDPHSQAVGWLYGHWLLGPVMQHLRIYPVPERLRSEVPASAWCVLEGGEHIYFNEELRLSAPQWAGVLSLAVLMQALDAPHQLPLPDPASDMAAQLAALHWWRTLKIGELPDWMDLPAELLAWGRLPLPELAARLRHEAPRRLERSRRVERVPHADAGADLDADPDADPEGLGVSATAAEMPNPAATAAIAPASAQRPSG